MIFLEMIKLLVLMPIWCAIWITEGIRDRIVGATRVPTEIAKVDRRHGPLGAMQDTALQAQAKRDVRDFDRAA